MRILYLLYNQQDSASEFSNNPKISLSWVDALLDELVKCEDLTIALAVPVNDNSIQKSQKKGITVFGLPNPEGKSIIKKAYKRLTRVAENIRVNDYIEEVVKDFKPDIIQIFGSENPFGLIVEKIKTPVIIHIQGYLFVWEGKWYSGISKREQFKYARLKNLLLMRGMYNSYFTFRKKAQTDAVIIKNSKYLMGRTTFDKRIAALISPGSKYFHCEEFIRKDFFEKEWNYELHKEISCVSIIKGTSYKGIDLLVKTMLVLNKYSSIPVKFKVCGISENEEIVEIIRKKYKNETDFKNMELLGKLSADDLVNQLCNSNFYVHPSYIENSPNSICEAMALGMPIIATNVGGVSTLIKDEAEGILVQEGEPYSLAGAILELINNYSKAKQLGYNARIKAFTRHDPDEIRKSLLDIYNKIINEDGRKDIS
jgi:glycosyltransferase involved in cell wall biosynthesis